MPQSEGWMAPRGMNLGGAVSLSSGEGERSKPEVPEELMKWKKAARTPRRRSFLPSPSRRGWCVPMIERVGEWPVPPDREGMM